MKKRFKAIFFVICAAFAMRACVLEPVRMSDESMSPALAEGEIAFVSRLAYGLRVPGAGAMLLKWQSPQKGDLVVAVAVGDPPMNMLRRVDGLPGDEIGKTPEGQPIKLKSNEYFLVAEQTEGVMDSRKLGPIPERAIIGKVTYLWGAKKSSNETQSQVESSEPQRGTSSNKL
jgi:signal peptidase I